MKILESKVARMFPPLRYFGIANMITTLVISSGFIAVLLLVKGNIPAGLTLLAFAVGMDRLDGLVARAMKDYTPLGEQLDSLADGLAFCFLPAFAAYSLGFNSFIDSIVLILYVAAGLWRLAYFNISGVNEEENKTYFIGIPTTICASWFIVLSQLWLISFGSLSKVLFYFFFLTCSIAMVSGIRYNKNGIWTKLLYLLVPLSVVSIWFI